MSDDKNWDVNSLAHTSHRDVKNSRQCALVVHGAGGLGRVSSALSNSPNARKVGTAAGVENVAQDRKKSLYEHRVKIDQSRTFLKNDAQCDPMFLRAHIAPRDISRSSKHILRRALRSSPYLLQVQETLLVNGWILGNTNGSTVLGRAVRIVLCRFKNVRYVARTETE